MKNDICFYFRTPHSIWTMPESLIFINDCIIVCKILTSLICPSLNKLFKICIDNVDMHK